MFRAFHELRNFRGEAGEGDSTVDGDDASLAAGVAEISRRAAESECAVEAADEFDFRFFTASES